MAHRTEIETLKGGRGRDRLSLLAAVAYSAVLQTLACLPDPAARRADKDAVTSLGQAIFAVPLDWRDIAHVPVYWGLGVAWFCAFFFRAGSLRSASRRAALTAVSIGVITELSQIPLVTRVFSLRDLASNIVGGLSGVMIAALLCARHLRRVG